MCLFAKCSEFSLRFSDVFLFLRKFNVFRMKRVIIYMLFSLLFANGVHATAQMRDTLIVEGKKYLLDQTSNSLIVDFGRINGLYCLCPFVWTGLYRGAVATWKVENDSLYLVSIDRYAVRSPCKETIDSLSASLKSKPCAFFTGVLSAVEERYSDCSYLFEIEKGRVVRRSEGCVSARDFSGKSSPLCVRSEIYESLFYRSKTNELDGKKFVWQATGEPLFLMKDRNQFSRFCIDHEIYRYTAVWEKKNNMFYLADIKLYDKEGNETLGSKVGLNEKMEPATSLNGLFLVCEKVWAPVVLGHSYEVYLVENGRIKEEFKVKKHDKVLDERLDSLLKLYKVRYWKGFREFMSEDVSEENHR